jgi:hypothetical protein
MVLPRFLHYVFARALGERRAPVGMTGLSRGGCVAKATSLHRVTRTGSVGLQQRCTGMAVLQGGVKLLC